MTRLRHTLLQNAALRKPTPMRGIPHRFASLGAVIALGLLSNTARGNEPLPEPSSVGRTNPSVPTPLTGLLHNASEAFTRWENLALFAAAGVSTLAMVTTPADHGVHLFFHDNVRAPAWGHASYYTGYALPVAVPLGLYAGAAIVGDSDLWGAAAATTQALAFTLTVTGLLKVATGRTFPTHGEDPNNPTRFQHEEYTREFRPFSGAWAWPSGHTSASICIAAALTAYYPSRVWIPLTTYPLAMTIGIGMIAGENHWASDVLAGALLGQAIGYAVGRAFRERVGGSSPDQRQPTIASSPLRAAILVPITGPGYNGVVLGTRF